MKPQTSGENQVLWFALGVVLLVSMVVALRREAPPSAVPRRDRLSRGTPTQANTPPGRLFPALTEPLGEHLTEALLGGAGAGVSAPARQLLGQAVLSLNHTLECIRRIYPAATPDDSETAVLQAYGKVLFINDFAYTCRVCPSLDADLAETAYSNALRVVTQPELLAVAREAWNAGRDGMVGSRPVAPMEDHYELTRSPYSELVEVVGGLVGYDPLSTDLMNDVLLYVTSKSEAEEFHRDILRDFSRLARAEASGEPALLHGQEGGDEESGLDPPNVDSSIRHQFVKLLTAYREIFGFRFRNLHGITDERFLEILATYQAPPTQWLHIQPTAQ